MCTFTSHSDPVNKNCRISVFEYLLYIYDTDLHFTHHKTTNALQIILYWQFRKNLFQLTQISSEFRTHKAQSSSYYCYFIKSIRRRLVGFALTKRKEFNALPERKEWYEIFFNFITNICMAKFEIINNSEAGYQIKPNKEGHENTAQWKTIK